MTGVKGENWVETMRAECLRREQAEKRVAALEQQVEKLEQLRNRLYRHGGIMTSAIARSETARRQVERERDTLRAELAAAVSRAEDAEDALDVLRSRVANETTMPLEAYERAREGHAVRRPAGGEG